MKHLKEMKEKKNQKETSKENPPPPHPRAREGEVDINAILMVPSAYNRGITRKDLKATANLVGMSAQEVNEWQKYMVACGWRFTTGVKVNCINFRRSLRMWHRMEDIIRAERMGRTAVDIRNEAVERQEKSKLKGLAQLAKVNPSLWALCRERCANSDTCGCKCGIKVPPDLQLPRPHRPEECPHFMERIEVA